MSIVSVVWSSLFVILVELTIVNYSSVIYAFVGSVQHYIVQQKLVTSDWIEPFKFTFLFVNAIVGNILLITQVRPCGLLENKPALCMSDSHLHNYYVKRVFLHLKRTFLHLNALLYSCRIHALRPVR